MIKLNTGGWTCFSTEITGTFVSVSGTVALVSLETGISNSEFTIMPSDITWGPLSKVGLWITTLLGGLEPEFVLVIVSTLVMESVPFKSGKSADKESSGPSSSKVCLVFGY